ncbi:MAG: hemerythrin domain-containing protein [bacterium]
MKATDILSEEHRIILSVLQCLEKIAAEAEEKGKLNSESANAAITFFRNFADRCHHAKEEDRLFGVMEKHGIPRQGGPIGVMLLEHDTGRGLVRGMAQSVDEAAQGVHEAIQKFTENAHNFIALLRDHIDKEDQCLFPMADQTLDTEAADVLLSEFKKIESDAGGKRHSEYIEIAKQLCDQYGIDFVSDSELKTLMTEFHVT